MEQMRHDKIIGSSLDAEVDIYCDDNTYKLLEKLGDELRFVFITSYALHKIVKLVKNGVLMIIHIYAKAFIMHIFFLRHRP
jgi:hypothetical protein